MVCDARIRPFVTPIEVLCNVSEPEHTSHTGVVRDMAWPGSKTELHWQESDRRNYHGPWPGRCTLLGNLAPCTLPVGHRGNCAP